MEKHFTATSYIIDDEKVLLHLHEKIGKWLPPGGHIEENEAPHEAAIREAKEETGLDIHILSDDPLFIHKSNARSLPRPWMILLEEIPEHKGVPFHQHIDCIYAAEPIGGTLMEGFEWLSLDEVEALDTIFEETREVIRRLLCPNGPFLSLQPARM